MSMILLNPKHNTTDLVSRNIRLFSAYAGMSKRDIATFTNQHETNVGKKFLDKVAWTLKDIDYLANLFDLEPYEFFLENPDFTKIDVNKLKRKLPQLDSNQQPFDYRRVLVVLACFVGFWFYKNKKTV